MRNRSSCSELNEQDVRAALQVLDSCAKHYHALQLSAHCDAVVQEGTCRDLASFVGANEPNYAPPTRANACPSARMLTDWQISALCLLFAGSEPGGSGCPDVPDACTRHNAVYHLLHYLTDAEFLANGSRHLKYAAMFLPVARSTALLPYYRSLRDLQLPGNSSVRLAGMDLGLKEALFNEYVIRDSALLCIGAALVCLLMWWYTASIFLTFMSVTAVFLSLAVAYTIYSFVFELDFFPFMNLLAAVILVGIGADDVFVYVQVLKLKLLLGLKSR